MMNSKENAKDYVTKHNLNAVVSEIMNSAAKCQSETPIVHMVRIKKLNHF